MRGVVRNGILLPATVGLFVVFHACGTTEGNSTDTVDAVIADVGGSDVPESDLATEDAREGDDTAAADVATDVSGDGIEDAGGEDVPSAYRSLPVAACGMPSYELIDPATLGQVVAWEEIPLWDVTAEILNGMLDETEYGAFDVKYGAKVYRMRYTTQDRGQVVEATAVVAVPQGEGLPEGPLPILLHTHGTTGLVDECAPSHPDNALTLSAVPALMSGMGYVFVGPDYIGMNGFGDPATVRHAYLVGEQVAIGSWDAVRAARRALASELSPAVPMSKRVVPWGESQGGHAALFVELFAPYYAPEFDVPAVVQLVGPENLMPILQYATAEVGSASGLTMVALVAMNEWYGHQGELDSLLTDEEPYFLADVVLDAIYPEGQCSTAKVPKVDTIDQVFSADALAAIADADWEALQPWSCYFAENSLPTTSVPPLRFTPTLMVYGDQDDLMLIDAARAGFQELCGLGWQLDHLECGGAGHVEAAILSLDAQFKWVAARMAGEPIDPERVCVLQDPVTCSLGE